MLDHISVEKNLLEFVRTYKDIISDNVRVIFELGARDCNETLGFHKLFPDAQIFTFECNPATLPICREAVQAIPSIHLIEKAVANRDGIVKFYPIDPTRTETSWSNGNPGASSLFKASGKYPVEKYFQNEIEVEAISLKTFLSASKINQIDLLWMDIQGAELIALEGLGEWIKRVRLIHLEVEFIEIYGGQPLYPQIAAFLKKNGFVFVKFTYESSYSGDVIFANRRYFRNVWELGRLVGSNWLRQVWQSFRRRVKHIRSVYAQNANLPHA
jgi:FkbM family methyltransferase